MTEPMILANGISQLSRDWLDALAILARVLNQPRDVYHLAQTYQPAVYPKLHKHLIVIQPAVEEAPALIDIHCPEFNTLPRIERVEILTYAAAGVWFNEHYPGDAFNTSREAFEHLCFRAGCWHTNTAEISRRWMHLNWKTPYHLLPVAIFEDRPKCGICASPVPTGAGTWKTDGTYRADLHHECFHYAHLILAPMVKEERERRASLKEVDK